MTMRLDIVSNDAGELVRLEHARDMGSATVQAVYRLLKLVQIHDLGNQAFLRQLPQTHEAIVDYGLQSGVHFNVLFASKAVFVGGQLLKGSRATYEAATELGDILEWCGGSDLTILKDVGEKEIQLFAEAVGAALRYAKGTTYKAPSPKIRLRPVTDAARFRGLEIENLTFEQRVVRTYASAVVIMRRFFDDLQASRYVLPRRIKRVAQSLVDLSEGSTPAFLGVTDVRNQNFDDAGRAVNTAILAVSMARELTGDRVLLAQIAMAAMMHDVGRPRAAALGEGGPRMPGVVRLSEDAEDKLAAGTAAVLTALGRVNEPTITRTVVAFEALWLRRERFLGPLYAGGRPASVHAKILQISRRYNDLVTPEPGLPPPQPDFAVATISEEMPDESDRTTLRLLVATLNLLPVGTVVQLTTNEVAEIIPSRSLDAPEGKTWVRLLRDAHGAVLETPVDFDLSAPRQGFEPERRISRVLSIEGWGKGLELIAEGEADGAHASEGEVSSGREPGHEGAARMTLDPLGPQADQSLAYAPTLQPPRDPGSHDVAAANPYAPAYPPDPAHITDEELETSGPSSSSVPSIASILSLPGPARDYEPSSISETVPSRPTPSPIEGSNPASGTSPSMVARAMGRVLEESAHRSTPDARPRSVALFEDTMMEVVVQLEELDPSARGTLTSTPIVHVLVYMLDHRQSGTVVLREVDGRHHVVLFQHGQASMIRNGRPIALLGDGLVASGLLSPEVLARALEVARAEGSLLGRYLVESGLVGAEALSKALSTQIPRKLERLVNLSPDTDYAFYEGLNLLPEWANGEIFPCHPLTAILAAVRSWHDRARVRATLSRIAKQALTFHPDVDLAGLILTGEEQSVVDAIFAGNYTLSALYDLRVAGEDTVSSIVYAFAVTRSFAFTASKGLPMLARASSEELPEFLAEDVESAPPPAPASPLPPHPPASFRTAPGVPSIFTAGYSSMPPQFGATGTEFLRPNAANRTARSLPPDGPGLTIVTGPPPALTETSAGGPRTLSGDGHGATLVMQAMQAVPIVESELEPLPADSNGPPVTWRPAKVRAAGALDPVRTTSRRPPGPEEAGPNVSARPMTGAPPSMAFRESQVKKSPSRVAPPDDEDSSRLVEAMADFRMAEAALGRSDNVQAELLARRAFAAEPSNSDYGALVAWVSALSGERDAIPLAVAKLNVILKDDALCERALLYRGRLYKRAKRSAEALRDFTSVLDINPKNAEAATEARILRMKKK